MLYILLTLLPLLVSLLHGDQGRKVSLIVGQDQRGAVTTGRRHLEGQIEPSKWDGSERWNLFRRWQRHYLAFLCFKFSVYFKAKQRLIYLHLQSLWASCLRPPRWVCATHGPAQTHGIPPNSHRQDPLSYPPWGKTHTHTCDSANVSLLRSLFLPRVGFNRQESCVFSLGVWRNQWRRESRADGGKDIRKRQSSGAHNSPGN